MSAPFIGHTSSASHDRQCNCLACREGRVTSANPHGWADDNEIPLCPLGQCPWSECACGHISDEVESHE